MTKQRARKRKQIQQGSTIEYRAAADQVASGSLARVQQSKKARSRGASGKAQPTQRRCGQCGGTGHNARTCQVDAEEFSESDASTQIFFSDSSESDNDDAVT